MADADWGVLDLTDDPVPGDPAEVQTLARRLLREAEYARQQADRLQKIAANHADLRMEGDYAERFRTVLTQLPELATDLGPAHESCGKALATYADSLEQAKLESRIALSRGIEADAQYRAALQRFCSVVPVPFTGNGIGRGLNGQSAASLSQYQPLEVRQWAVEIGEYAGRAETERQNAAELARQAARTAAVAQKQCAAAIRAAIPSEHSGTGTRSARGEEAGAETVGQARDAGTGGSGGSGSGSGSGSGKNGPKGSAELDTPRGNEPLPEMTPAERKAHWNHLKEVEQRNPEEFDRLQRDPDKNGGISEPSKDEARVVLDLREQGRLPDDIQRPSLRDSGDFASPLTGRHYDIKGVHSDWPPFNNVRDKSQPFRGAYDPANNARWVSKLAEQIRTKNRTVILDVRNADQAAIDDLKSIVKRNGWEDHVIWYP
ncbi:MULTISPECIES: hypothetical protein [Streptomyces]|uniref:hypothetical protein n=1 Tax=Streptomyces TaxID=1883 RepID=UPI0016740F96|nr:MULTISPECIES: hypothetical protein [Streptomyces]MBK3526982.1 hypothetical protein [Streptomyces sp. MBT70]GGR96728.1 hypothetical protein GCM10010236_59170 [Streptomyces eurythermus]